MGSHVRLLVGLLLASTLLLLQTFSRSNESAPTRDVAVTFIPAHIDPAPQAQSPLSTLKQQPPRTPFGSGGEKSNGAPFSSSRSLRNPSKLRPSPTNKTSDWSFDCKSRWSRKVQEFITLRDNRRLLAESRPPIVKGPGWGPSTWLRSFVFDPYDPEWNCGSKRKIGIAVANGNDGPKWTCGVHLLKRPCVIFSLGCNNLIDFESEMYKWGRCKIHVFDPTVDGSVAPSLKQQAGASLHLLGLGTPGERLGNGELTDLGGLMKAARVKEHIDVLKIDVEGYEWSPLLQVFKDQSQGKLSIGQLQVELHTMLEGATHYLDMGDQGQVLEAVRRLFEAADAAGMLLFSKEPNTAFCERQDCGEWSWVSTRFALEEFIDDHCPSMLPFVDDFEPIPQPPYPTY